tara:strand:- start:12458 stop:13633 length:1176 start_codon:yes stop_codon:yes gene_type:complete
MNFLNLKSLKKTQAQRLSVFLCICLISASLYAQRSVRIGYIDTEYVLENIDEYTSANAQLEAKAEEWKAEIERRFSSLEDQKKQLINERVLLTNELITEREEDLQIIETEIIEYQQKRFGPGGDLMIQKKQLIQPIQDQIFSAVQEIASSKKYDFIFDKSADVVMLYSADKYDVSEQVLRTINRSSKRTQAKSKKERKQAKEEETIVQVDSGKTERQKILEDRKAERKAILEKKRQEQLEARELRKKELEAKRQKKLDERTNARSKRKNSTVVASNETADEKNETDQKLSPREKRKKQLETQKKTLEEKKKKALDERAEALKIKKTASDSTEKISDESTQTNQTLSPREKRKKELEARKKALEEKKKKQLEERKARIEAQRKKRDSIKNNK